MKGEEAMAQIKADDRENYVILLDLLAKANDAVDVSSINDASEREKLFYALSLANKFIGHALTILHLSHGTVIQGLPSLNKIILKNKLNFPDSASIDVLTRVSFEAFLVFHYVFFAPTKADEKNFRYWSYKAAGIAEWQNLTESISEHEQEKAEEKKELNELRERLKSNTVFESLTDNRKKRILKGKWRLLPWREIAIDAGFSKMLASRIYRYLSGSAHSSSLSILRMAQALNNKEPEKFIQGSIRIMNILTANMIQEYSGLFPNTQDVLKESGASNFVGVWIQIGHSLDEFTNIGRGND